MSAVTGVLPGHDGVGVSHGKEKAYGSPVPTMAFIVPAIRLILDRLHYGVTTLGAPLCERGPACRLVSATVAECLVNAQLSNAPVGSESPSVG